MNTNDYRYGKQRKIKSLIGQRFGALTVIERADNKRLPSGKTAVMWYCKCDCGKTKIIGSGCLKNGNTRSCGCLQYMNKKQNPKSKNIFDISGEYGIGYDGDTVFYFDKEDYDLIRNRTWRVDCNGYMVAHTMDKDHHNISILMHRVIMKAKDGEIVDHINGSDTIRDNRKSNLRIVTPSQNSMNSSLSKNNTSGIKGVWYSKSKNKWCARITKDYKAIHLGTFNTQNEAIEARLKAEKEIFGEYRRKDLYGA